MINLEEDIGSSSIMSGSEDDYGTHVSLSRSQNLAKYVNSFLFWQSLDRRRRQQQQQQREEQRRRPPRSRSTGALNHLLHDAEESDEDVRFRGMDTIREDEMQLGTDQFGDRPSLCASASIHVLHANFPMFDATNCFTTTGTSPWTTEAAASSISAASSAGSAGAA